MKNLPMQLENLAFRSLCDNIGYKITLIIGGSLIGGSGTPKEY
jgi:hypothetical protein